MGTGSWGGVVEPQRGYRQKRSGGKRERGGLRETANQKKTLKPSEESSKRPDEKGDGPDYAKKTWGMGRCQRSHSSIETQGGRGGISSRGTGPAYSFRQNKRIVGKNQVRGGKILIKDGVGRQVGSEKRSVETPCTRSKTHRATTS